MSNSIPVLRFLFRQDFKILKEALNLAPRYEVIEFPHAPDLSTYMMDVPAALVIISLRDKEDLVQIANLMKLNKKLPKETAIKYVVVNFSGDKNFEKAIAKLGIQELLDPNLNTKALKFKLDFWMKALNGQMKKNETAFNNSVKASEINKAEDKRPSESAPVMIAPLELEDDIWLLKSESECRKVLGKWLVRIVGPGPYIGQWNEVKSGLWRFDVKPEEKDLYVSDNGSWFFSGDQKPDFVWKENNWLMSGESFDLYYKTENKTFSRLNSKNKVLTVAKNSLYAKTKETFILESFEKDIAFKKESDKLENLSGENSTDHLNGGPLSGKNGPSDQLGGNLSGSVEKTDSIQSGPLSQKATNSKEESHWGGKIDPTQAKGPSGDGSGPASEKPRTGAELTLDEKNGKVQKHYKNHNTPEEFEAGKLLDMQAERAKQKDPLKGPAADALNEGSLLDLDVKDNHHQSHYKNQTAAGQTSTAEKEKKSKGYQEEAISSKQSTPASDGVREGSSLELDQNSNSIDKFLKNKNNSLSGEAQKETKDSSSETYGNEKSSKVSKSEEALGRSSSADKEKSYGSEKSDADRGSSGRGSFESWKQKSRSINYESADENEKSDSELFDDSSSSNKKPDLLEMASEAKKNKKDSGYEDESSSSQNTSDAYSESDPGNILPFNAAEEKRMEELTQDAQIKSVLIQKNKRIDCRFDDFFDNTIIFSSTVKGVEDSGNVTLDLAFKYKKEDNKLIIEGEVVSIDDDGEGNNYITIRVSSQNVLAFDEYIKLFQERQKNISEFLKTVKGI